MADYVITRIGRHGDGIATSNGRTVFVPLTLPGETVSGEVSDERLTDVRLTDVRVIVPSPDRIKPLCPKFGTCGGCSFQHASDEFLARWKTEEVARALGPLAREATIFEASTSPPQSRRRATLAARRTKKGVTIGFHARASDVISDISPCLLISPEIVAAVPMLENLVRLGASRKAEVSLAVTVSRAGLDVAITGAKPLDGPLVALLAQTASNDAIARLVWNGDVIASFAAPVQRLGRVDVTPPPGSFLQATLEGQAALTHAVLDIIGPARRVVDLFSGCGTFALAIADQAAVHAVEAEAAALAALMDGARASAALKPVTHECRDLFRRPLLAEELATFDAVVIDPPRAGAAAQVQELAKSTIGKIAYVSCNPATFARDAAALIDAGFTLDALTVVDQFRWSPHVELVAAFSR